MAKNIVDCTNITAMYQQIPTFDREKINLLEMLVHQAVQFLAMFGTHYVAVQPDDSHANLGFDPGLSSIYSRTSDEASMGMELDLKSWELTVRRDQEARTLGLAGERKGSVHQWLQSKLSELGLDGDKLAYLSHYEIPSHPIDSGSPYPTLDQKSLEVWLTMRSNAHLLLSELNDWVGLSSEIRIWPHHFDTGTYYPINEGASLGAGWAVADTLCDQPYFYIFGSNKDKELDYSSVPNLGVGRWIVAKEWKGAVIGSSELSSIENQYECWQEFLAHATGFFNAQFEATGLKSGSDE